MGDEGKTEESGMSPYFWLLRLDIWWYYQLQNIGNIRKIVWWTDKLLDVLNLRCLRVI